MILKMAVGIVWRAGESGPQVLVARRLDIASHAPGMREFPGGKVEGEETPEQCAEREILEETGLQVLVGAPYEIIRWAYPEREIEMHAFDCSILHGEARAIESKEIAWLQVHELQASEFPRANRKLIEEIQRRHAS